MGMLRSPRSSFDEDWDDEDSEDDPEAPSDEDLERFGSDTIRCPACRAEIHDESVACPRCGHWIEDEPPRSPGGAMARWLVVLVVLALSGAAGVLLWLFR